MSLLLAAVRDAGLILCLSAQTGDPCTVSPIVVEAEVAPAAAAAKGRFSWRVDGKEVYSGILTFEGGRPQRVAMVLEPRKPEHLVSLEVKIGKTKSRRDLRLSRAICPFLLQLEDFSLSSKGVELVVTNRGPFPSGPGVLEWRINGVRSHRNQVDSIPPGGRASFLLPAETSGMLEKALTQLFLFGGRRRVPVVVSARLEFAPTSCTRVLSSSTWWRAISSGRLTSNGGRAGGMIWISAPCSAFRSSHRKPTCPRHLAGKRRFLPCLPPGGA
ncbi:MAG: hypothetical protein AB1751_00510 [Acidobacteriota bacterium]